MILEKVPYSEPYKEFTLTAESTVTYLEYTAFVKDNVVYICGNWEGSVTGSGSIAFVPAEYAPKTAKTGSGMIKTANFGWAYGLYHVTESSGTHRIYQTNTSGEVTSGEFTFIYPLG